MNFSTLKAAQGDNIRILENSFKKNRLAHAYIFEGEAGTKKFDTALFFAAMILCESDDTKPCGTCKNCRRIFNQRHPNLYTIKPQKQNITKDNIRDLQEEFNKTALEDGAKVYIMEDADTMNPHAANALLKFLEEPHPNIFALLLTTNSSKLLPTIRSRSQKLTFHTIPHHLILSELIESGYEPFLARLASAMHHTVNEAEVFLAQENLYDMIDIVSHLYEALANKESLVLTFDKEIFGVVSNKDDSLMLLDVMIYYQKDLIYGKMKHYKKQIFQEQLATIETILTFKSKAMLLEELEQMLELKNRLNQFVNTRLAFDNLLMFLERRMDSEE